MFDSKVLNHLETKRTRRQWKFEELLWLTGLLKDLQVEVSDPTMIYYDNINTIQLVKNPVFHAWTKHIKVQYQFVCKHVLSSEVKLVFVPTHWHTTNIFTKPLGLDKLRKFSSMLGL